jgi:hypothetical protein
MMTKRKWRRFRGRIISANSGLKNLRKVPYRHAFVMEDLVRIFYYKVDYSQENKFWFCNE